MIDLNFFINKLYFFLFRLSDYPNVIAELPMVTITPVDSDPKIAHLNSQKRTGLPKACYGHHDRFSNLMFSIPVIGLVCGLIQLVSKLTLKCSCSLSQRRLGRTIVKGVVGGSGLFLAVLAVAALVAVIYYVIKSITQCCCCPQHSS